MQKIVLFLSMSNIICNFAANYILAYVYLESHTIYHFPAVGGSGSGMRQFSDRVHTDQPRLGAGRNCCPHHS